MATTRVLLKKTAKQDIFIQYPLCWLCSIQSPYSLTIMKNKGRSYNWWSGWGFFRFPLLDLCFPATLSSGWDYVLESRTSKWQSVFVRQRQLPQSSVCIIILFRRRLRLSSFCAGVIANSRGFSSLEISKVEWCVGCHISRQTYMLLF